MKNIILGGLVFFFTILLLWYLIYYQLFYIETKFKTKFETKLEGLDVLKSFGTLTQENIKDIQKTLKGSSDPDVLVSQLQSLELSGAVGSIINDEQNNSYKILQNFLVEFNSQAESLYSNNLLIYYPFDKESSGSIINESSSNNGKNNGSSVKPIVIDFNEPPGIKKASMVFDADNEVQIPSITFDNGGKFSGFTAAFWFKPKQVGYNAEGGCIFDFYVGNGIYDNIAILYVQNMIALRVLNSDISRQDGLTIVIDQKKLETWGHYVCTISKNGSTAIYLNGAIIDQSDKKSENIIPSISPRLVNKIGKTNIWGYRPLNGCLSDFRVYDTEWKADTVKNYYDYVNFKITMNNSTNDILNFHLDGKATESITNDNTGILIWKDTVWKGTTNGIASDTSVIYHTTSQKVTIPAGSYIDIPTNNNDFGAPFTIYIVANVYDFNPTKLKGIETDIAYNHLVGSSEYNGLEVLFYQNHFCLDLLGKNERVKMPVPSIPPIDPKIPHIFTVTCDSNGTLSFYIDSRSLIRKKKIYEQPNTSELSYSISLCSRERQISIFKRYRLLYS